MDSFEIDTRVIYIRKEGSLETTVGTGILRSLLTIENVDYGIVNNNLIAKKDIYPLGTKFTLGSGEIKSEKHVDYGYIIGWEN